MAVVTSFDGFLYGFRININTDGTMSINGLAEKLGLFDAKDAEQDGRLDVLEADLSGFEGAQEEYNSGVSETLETLGGRVTGTETRLDAVEAKNTAQDTAISGEIGRAQEAENALSTAVGAEQSRAQTAEGVLSGAISQEATARGTAIADAVKTTLTDAAGSDTLPPTTESTFTVLFQSIRNFLKWVKSAIADKVDKTTYVNRVYATDGTGAQTSYTLSKDAYENTVAWRETGGALKVGSPTDNQHAANKGYVDAEIAAVAQEAYPLIDSMKEIVFDAVISLGGAISGTGNEALIIETADPAFDWAVEHYLDGNLESTAKAKNRSGVMAEIGEQLQEYYILPVGKWEALGVDLTNYYTIAQTDAAVSGAVGAEAGARDTAIGNAVKTTLTDAAGAETLPATTESTWPTLMQTVRNFLKWAKDAISGKVNKSGDTMSGNLNMDGNDIGSVGVLADVSAIVAKDGNLLIKGQIELDADHGQPKDNIKNVKDPVDGTDAANKTYVDTADADKVDKLATTGISAYVHNGSTQGEIGISNSATGSTLAQRAADGTLEVATPTDNADAANKGYVDARAVPPITTIGLGVVASTASYHLLGTVSRAATNNITMTTLMVQCNVGAGGNLDYSFILTLPTAHSGESLSDLVNNSRKINLGTNAKRVGIYVYLNTSTNNWEVYLYVPATANYVPASVRVQAVFHTAVASIFVPNSSGAAVSLPSGALQVPESKGLTETNLALGNDTRFAATNSYKLSNTGAGMLIDLGEKIASGLQVFIDAVYDETSGGNEVVHAQLSFSLYGNAASDARNGVSKQGFGHALVNAYHTILDNGHDAIWIPKQVSTHFPSVVISSAYKNTNAYTVQPTGTPLNISVTTDAEPVTTLAQIANKTDTGITGWTTVSSPAASGSYSVSYSNMYLAGRYTTDSKPVWRRDYRINGYVMSNTTTPLQDQLTDSNTGGIPDTALLDLSGWYQASSNYRSQFPIAGHGSSLPSYAKLMQFNGGTQILSVNSGFSTTATLGWWVEFTR